MISYNLCGGRARIAFGITMLVLLLAGNAHAVDLNLNNCNSIPGTWDGNTCTVSGEGSMGTWISGDDGLLHTVYIPAGITLEITSSGSITFEFLIRNRGTIINNGIVNNYANFNNNGTIVNNGIINIYEVFSNRGTLTNRGIFINECGGVINDFIDSGSSYFYPIQQQPCYNIPAIVDVKPDTLNKASQGGAVTAYIYIELPGYNLENIDINTVKLRTIKGEVSAMLSPPEVPPEVGDYDGDGKPDRMVKFDRQAVIGIVDVGDVTVTISGKISGEDFEGTDVIRVIDNHEQIPEFPTIALPILSIIGLMFLFQRKGKYR